MEILKLIGKISQTGAELRNTTFFNLYNTNFYNNNKNCGYFTVTGKFTKNFLKSNNT